MQTHCPSCGAPITEDVPFCSHCGARLPEHKDPKLEEVRLKYEREEKERQENKAAAQSRKKAMKIRIWISWALTLVFFCLMMFLYKGNESLLAIIAILFFVSGIYAIIVSLIFLFRKR